MSPRVLVVDDEPFIVTGLQVFFTLSNRTDLCIIDTGETFSHAESARRRNREDLVTAVELILSQIVLSHLRGYVGVEVLNQFRIIFEDTEVAQET